MTDKRYRECMAEIIGVLKKYDMAGAVTIVDKERSMFKYHFPTWTCIELGETYVRVRMKGKEWSDPHKTSELTAHVLMQMRDIAANTFAMVESLRPELEKKWGMEHTPNVDFDPELNN
ncbi:MAG TPA: hypothetical protein VNK48_14400 [Xanthobacteraceae bacterium]|nr:hypothetical protein [Xanthobacteraceae bacterium]